MNDGRDARLLLRSTRSGALATLSEKSRGHPYGSLVPFMLDSGALPVLLVSRLAEHTRNMNADPRVSLLVFHHDFAQDVQAGARANLMGIAAPVTDPSQLRPRYLRFFPDAARLLDMGDFDFYRIESVSIRLIAGFGDVRWISGTDYAPPSNELSVSEELLIANFNGLFGADFHSLVAQFQANCSAKAVMIGIDCDGFDLRAAHRLLRFNFSQPVGDPAAAQHAIGAIIRNSNMPRRDATNDL